MNPNDEIEWLSVAEFARRAGVSRQAIYKALSTSVSTPLSTELSTYCKLVDNEKRLSSAALALYCQPSCQPSCQPVNRGCQPGCQPEPSEIDTPRPLESDTERLKNDNAELRREVERLKAQIAILEDATERQRKEIADTNSACFELLTEQQQRHETAVAETQKAHDAVVLSLTAQASAERERAAAIEEDFARQNAALVQKLSDVTQQLSDALARAQTLQHEAQMIHAAQLPASEYSVADDNGGWFRRLFRKHKM